MENKNWKQVGTISVDAGLCWVGDPCYCITPDCDEHPAQTWSEFCNAISDHEQDAKQWNFKLGTPGLGVSVSTGYGDGSYPVFIRRNRDGRVAEVKVVFDED
ncbi:MAG: DUF4241 domain-containing protein [Phycisphaerae bacterium]|nr:DUF4241 domain-containing protein [Phycisphaerae bacterium]